MAFTNYDYDSGTTNYTADYSTNYAMAIKFARSIIRNVESANPLQWIDKGEVDNGLKLEEAVINLQESSVWNGETDTGSNLLPANYPDIRVRIFEEWNQRQFKTSVSDEQIRKILLSGGDDADVAQKIVSNLTESEGYEDYKVSKALLANAVTTGVAVKYKDAPATGGVAMGQDLALAIHNTVKSLQYVNSDYVSAQDKAGTPLLQRTPFSRIRIVIPYQIRNKLNITYLASLFNMELADLLGKISEIDEGENVYVLDEFAVGKVRRLYRLTDFYVSSALRMNYFLTLDRMYYANPLYKFAYIPVATTTAQAAKA